MRKIVIVQGLQYGSEAKGSISACVAKNWGPDTVVTAWGPNAGHTVRDGDFKFVSTMLATGALYPSTARILIGPGSVVNLEQLIAEIVMAGERLRGKLLIIHPNAPLVTDEHREAEKVLLWIGSTMKGTMEAVIDKMRRRIGAIAGAVTKEGWGGLQLAAKRCGLAFECSERAYDAAIDLSEKMLIEGAQGYSLSIHGQFYPYCTSRDVSTHQLLADCRIPFPTEHNGLCVIGVCRTYPIRVANRKGTEGEQFTSGGFYEDQHELHWEYDLQRVPELTTVTKLPRRIFSFSYEQIHKAMRQMAPTMIALTFADYLEPRPREDLLVMGPRVWSLVKSIEDVARRAAVPANVGSVSYGPDLADIFGVIGGNSPELDPDVFFKGAIDE